MDRLRNYDVAFTGLRNGKHEFRFEADQSFFQMFDTVQEFTKPKIIAEVFLDKHTTFLEFIINISGTIELVCDISNQTFDHPIQNSIKVLVKFGEEYDDSNEEVITIPHGDHAFNIAQLLYENVMLAVPMKKISPDISDSDWKKLEKYMLHTPEEETEENSEEGDPRWAALQKLKDKN